MLETLAERRPGHVIFDVRLALDVILTHSICERPHRRAFTEHLERHTLADVARRAAVGDQRGDRPREHVDETRSDREAPGVYLFATAVTDPGHHRCDPIAIDRDIGDVRDSALAVVYRAAAQDDFLHRAALPPRGGQPAPRPLPPPVASRTFPEARVPPPTPHPRRRVLGPQQL